MQFVPGGTYRMGSDVEELDGIRAATGLGSVGPLMMEIPAHTVTVADFYIDAFDVTNYQFWSFVEAVPGWGKVRVDKSTHNGRYLEHWIDEVPADELLDHPVTFVTWQAAVAYCEWKNKRLPTEIEYEWAAQDGISRIEYPWGNLPPSDDAVNWGGNDINTTVPVGSYPPNARGLYDMSGNVWHFTADPWLGSYAETLASSIHRQDLVADPGVRRVVRGGSWGANAANLRVRYRDSHRPFDAREMVGFRCAKSIDAGERDNQAPLRGEL
jgi:formylglycine-generating enzyme required for sulfatase activity